MRTVIGLGSNLGDRLLTMRTAVAEIAKVAHFEAASRVYATAPVGGPPQDEFLNAAVLVRPSGTAIDLLDSLLAIEARMGRVRGERWGPRTIDLDILWMEGVVVEMAPRLLIPHPGLVTRAFALAPMLDLVADARDPRTGQRYTVPSGDIRVTEATLIEDGLCARLPASPDD